MPKAEVFYEKGKKYNFRNPAGTPYWRQSRVIGGKKRVFYGDGEKDCQLKIKAAEELSAAGLVYDYKNAKTGIVLKDWLMNIKRIDNDLKASSFARYETSYRNHIAGYDICNIPLMKLSTAHVQEYINGLVEDDAATVPTVKAVLKVWKLFINYAIDEGYIRKNPIQNVVIPGKRNKAKRKIETFTLAERDAIAKEMSRSGYAYADLIRLAFATGMRQGELFGLRYNDIRDNGIYISRSTSVVTHIDGEGNKDRYREVWDTKTENSERFIPLTADVLDMLQRHRVEQARKFSELGLQMPQYVFVTSTGELLDPSAFRKSYDRLLKRAGVPYRKFHAIRHTFATEALRNGVNIKDLQMLMGHADIQTTLKYVQYDEDSKRDAIEKISQVIAL